MSYKLNKKQKEMIEAYYREFSAENIVSYYSINCYMMTALEVLGGARYTYGLETATREFILDIYNREVYHYIDDYEEEIKGEKLL